MIAGGQVGAFLNVSGEEANRYQQIAVEQSRLRIPLLFGLDVIHGYRTIFSTPLALSASWDAGLVERTARIAATEARADGIRWTFSPMIDIARDARWGRITEGSRRRSLSRLGPWRGPMCAASRSYVGGPTSILACLKHYVGYGAAEGGRESTLTEIPERLLREVYLPPFKAGVDAGAATLMSAFNALNGVPASANAFTLGDILREEWQFRGFVVSDWTSIAETIAHGTAIDGAEAARRSIAAGVDMDMESDLYRTALADELKAGRLPLATIDQAVRRILRVKFAMGLFEDPYDRIEPQRTLLPVHRQLAREAAEKSFVLLKNDGVLPLQAGTRIALIGPLADSARDMLGAWSAKGQASDVITLREALAERPGTSLAHAEGTEIIGRFRQRFCRGGRSCPERRRRDPGARRKRARNDRRSGLADGARPARQPAGTAGRGRRDRQAGGAAVVQRTAAGADAGRRAGRRDDCGLVPRRGGGSGAGAHSLRRQQSERPADG